MITSTLLVSLALGLILPAAVGQDEPPPGRFPRVDLPPISGDVRLPEPPEGASRELAEDLAMLEALLRVRETRITEARRQVEFEQDYLEVVRNRHEAGGIPARMVQEAEARLIGTSALVEAREAERDEVAIRLEQLRRAIADPSPEPDLDERRARLEDEVRIREIQLAAREARVRAAEAQVRSEELKREEFRDTLRRGTESPGRIRQASHRVAEATAWRDTLLAERDLARLVLERARRRLAQFDDPDAADPSLERADPRDLASRVSALESLVDVLRDELHQVNWELQGLRNRMP